MRVSLSNERNFSWVFLVDWILTCIVTLTVIFYLGRIFAYTVSFILEWLLWKRWKVKVTIQALKIAPLGGSITFKNVCIIHKDYAASFLEGSITWRYWLLNSRNSQYEEEESHQRHEENGNERDCGTVKNTQLPCRFVMSYEGLELFLYNRTVAYENIIQMFSKEERTKFESFLDESSYSKLFTGENDDLCDKEIPESLRSTSSSDVPNINDRVFEQVYYRQKSFFVKFLPIQLLIHRGSVIIGNKFTSSILILSHKSAEGIIDLSLPKEKLDLYKMKFQLDYSDMDISIKQNIAYDHDMSLKNKLSRSKFSKVWSRFLKILRASHIRIKWLQDENEETDIFFQKWKGLSLYRGNAFDGDQDDMDDIHFDFASHEYAKVTNILKSPRIVATYEYDIPGVVPHGAHPTADGPEVGNNGSPPEFGLDIQIHGATICYGPWAQREIQHLQKIFSPIVSRSPNPTQTLSPGSRRIYTYFKTSFTIMEESSLRIPTREPSKDQDFLKKFKETSDDYRPFGWLDLKFSKESYGTVNTILCPTKQGYPNDLSIHLGHMEAVSSVNHDILLKCKSFDINAEIGYPLGWNSEANWLFKLSSSQLESFLLREHITLISDVFSDFSSGDPTPYELFRPFIYEVSWEMDGYSVYLNVNDHNIVNNPLDFNENCYLSLHGEELILETTIPHRVISERYTDISYRISTPMFRLLLNAPPWNTLNEFMKNKEVGRSYNFTMDGVYTLYPELDVDNVDTISVECSSTGTTLNCYGFVIRYLMNVKMNYFGDFINFVTSEEYTGTIKAKEGGILDQEQQEAPSDFLSDNESEEKNPDPYVNIRDNPPVKRSDVKRTTNETDIWFVFSVWEGALILPETIYNADPCVALHFGELVVDLRSCNYYMDLLATMNNTCIRRYSSRQPHEVFEAVRRDNGRSETVHGSLETLTIHGHRMYGLPPTEPTYFCQWGIDIDGLNINSSAEFVKGFFTSFGNIGFGYCNVENVLLYDVETPDDMTSVTVRSRDLIIEINDESSKCRAVLEIPNFIFTSIDFENEKYSQRLDVNIPIFRAKAHVIEEQGGEIVLFELTTKIKATNFIRNKNFVSHRRKQQDYITLNDSPFNRCPFLLPCYLQESYLYKELLGSIYPSSSLPPLPLPFLSETIDFIIEDFLGDYSKLLNSVSYHGDINDTVNSDDTSPNYDSWFPNEANGVELINVPTVTENTNNYVLDIEYITLDINPIICDHLPAFVQSLYKTSTIDIIDGLEISIVRKLSNLKNGSSSVSNTKLQLLNMNIFWGLKDFRGLDIFFDKLDFELRQSSIENESESTIIEMTVLSKLRSIRATVFEGIQERPPAVSLAIEGWEAWCCKGKRDVASFNVLSTDITVDESQLEWMASFIMEQKQYINKVVQFFQTLQSDWNSSQRELVCKLTAASEYYQISHDPYVITKPAFIMRLSKGHVRENRSWRIITRLRHILTYVPSDWHSVDYQKSNSKVSSQENAKNIFIAVFSNWRNWELSDVERSYMFKKVFPDEENEAYFSGLERIIKLSVNSFFFTVYSEGYRIAHNFVVTRANVVSRDIPAAENNATQSVINHERIVNITASIGSLKGELSDQVLKIKDLLPAFENTGTSHSHGGFGILNSYKYSAILVFERSELQLVLGQSRLTNRVMGGKLSFLLENPKESATPALSSVIFAQRCELWLKHCDAILAEAVCREFSISATAELGSHNKLLLFNVFSKDSHFRSMTRTDTLVKSVNEIENAFSEFKKKLFFGSKVSASKKKGSRADLKAEFALNFSNVSAELMFLSPFFIKLEMKQLTAYLNRLENNDILLSIWNADFILKSHQTTEQYLKLSCGDLQIKLKPHADSRPVIDLRISTSLVKLTLSEPRRILSSFLQDEKLIGESFWHLKNLIRLLSPPPKNQDLQKKLRWAVDANLSYFGLLVPMASTNFVLELHMLLASVTNANKGQNKQEDHISGNLSIENFLFLVNEPTLPVDLSKIVDFSIRVSTSQKVPNSPQSYQIESSHFRVCLSPTSLIYIMWGSHQLQSLLHYFKKHRIPHQYTKDLTNIFAKGYSSSNELPIEFRSIHILSYNLCVGWMFQLEDETNTGLILGFDRLFSAYEKNFGKLTLIGGYFSVLDANSNDTFFSQGAKKQKYNRSYLSNVQVSYWLKEADLKKDLFIRVHGETLDVSYLSTSFSVIDAAIQSLQKFQEVKKFKIHQSTDERQNKTTQESFPASSAPFLSHIRKINCEFHYEGGTYRFFTLDDLKKGEAPSLEIKSPVVRISLNYAYDENSKKPHWIRCLINIDPTHNILFSRCVPILSEFAENVRGMIHRNSSNNKQEESRVEAHSVDYKRLLDAYNIAFKISSGKQQLSLSCEPKAKVQADVGFESFSFSVMTNDLDSSEPLTVSLSIDKIQSSVRHIFSRETSASLNVDFVDISLFFTHPDIYGVALVSDVDVFFNMKQLQNLNLLLDIWKLSESVNTTHPAENEKKMDLMALPFAQPSKMRSALRWCFTIIVTNVSSEINLGPSLGVLSLKLKRNWLSTNHYGGKRQVLRAFADCILISSKGRFSGLFELKDVSWSSENRWPDGLSTKSTPDVSFCLEIAQIAVKAAFDYHMFLIGAAKSIKFRLRSEPDYYGILPDLLRVNLSFQEIDICATALTAASILDIYNTIMRMRQDNKISYIETLKESNAANTKEDVPYDDILRSLNLLRTDLTVDIAKFNVQISPISLFDVEVLVIGIDNVSARSETQSGEKLKTELHLQISNASVSLSTSKEELDEESLSSISVESYMKYAAKLKGGTIVKIPKLLVSMTTWQKQKSYTLEYLFTCKFFDKVAVKWNLGPVNFIKEMWSTHVRSLDVRRTKDDESIQDPQQPNGDEGNTGLNSKFKYVALDEPYIEMPQIKDLGDATPPLEWFGVHRKYLPVATHQMAVLVIQKLVHTAEKEYAKMQGHKR